MTPEENIEEYDLDDYEDEDICDCCGRNLSGYDGVDPCPYCCSHSFAAGSEECDWCRSSDECFKIYHARGLA